MSRRSLRVVRATGLEGHEYDRLELDEGVIASLGRSLAPTRVLHVDLCASDERRLLRYVDSLNARIPDDPINPFHDADLAAALMAAASSGMDVAETDDALWSDRHGECRPLPRARRAPWRWRLRFAVRAALRAWRST